MIVIYHKYNWWSFYPLQGCVQLIHLNSASKPSDQLRQEEGNISPLAQHAFGTTTCCFITRIWLWTISLVLNTILVRLDFFSWGGGNVNGLPLCLLWGGLVSAAVGHNDSLSLFWMHVSDQRNSEHGLIWLCSHWGMRATTLTLQCSFMLFLQITATKSACSHTVT